MIDVDRSRGRGLKKGRSASFHLTALVLTTGLFGPEIASAHVGGPPVDPDRWWTTWSPSFLQVLPIFVVLGLYLWRAARLGPRLPRWRAVCFLGGIAVLLVALTSPIDPIGEQGLFSVHMGQHMLLGDLAPLLLVLGATGPVLRPVLAKRTAQRIKAVTHPVSSLIIWAAITVIWHLPVMYEAALRNPLIHAAEHACFFTAGCLMWGALIETLPGPEWFGTGMKLGYVAAVRVVTTILGNIFWWSGTPIYGAYRDDTAAWGLSPLQDQAMAGTVMMAYTGATTLTMVAVLFFRMAKESELRQQLIEAGVDPRSARRAIRYGRGEALANRHGVASTPLVTER